ncbi:uncharacterized protein K452DRAFT_276550 [Aplosporella prunicola CBS 121167]|uniref:Alpha/beta hydrolase fold-3 domain-containing protein n=1 Tax=Aplosporella prunicola CBS 121167 TaxID=1176127 RepID=A0A6A6B3J8_9PEZI|nr:uncharacterized protein K452DRAFT_276550 [Aplosporella prunicola CBS 121167]KAF2138779.1 hypothetical protein K452DRAFT_276550 [Aplosporella prunicola CBS 121167]
MTTSETYPPPKTISQPVLNEIPENLVPRFDPVFVELHNRYQRGRLHTHQIPIEWYRADPAKYTITYGREFFATTRVRITEQKCPVKDGEITVRIFEPTEKRPGNRPAYMNFHGGGWVLGGLHFDHEFCKRLTHKLGIVVFDVDYRLAPEHRYPTQIEDCWAAFQWMRTQKAAEFDLDVLRLAVGGASAGGHLSEVVAIMCRDEGIPLAFQLLVVPVCDMHVFTPTGELDPNCPYESYREMWNTAALPGERMSFFHKHWLGNPRPKQLDNDWHISPIKHPDLSNLAPALVITAEMDPLRDEGEAYGRKMNKAGSKAEIWRIPGVPHTVIHLDGVLEGGRQFNARVVETLSKVFGVPILE